MHVILESLAEDTGKYDAQRKKGGTIVVARVLVDGAPGEMAFQFYSDRPDHGFSNVRLDERLVKTPERMETHWCARSHLRQIQYQAWLFWKGSQIEFPLEIDPDDMPFSRIGFEMLNRFSDVVVQSMSLNTGEYQGGRDQDVVVVRYTVDGEHGEIALAFYRAEPESGYSILRSDRRLDTTREERELSRIARRFWRGEQISFPFTVNPENRWLPFMRLPDPEQLEVTSFEPRGDDLYTVGFEIDGEPGELLWRCEFEPRFEVERVRSDPRLDHTMCEYTIQEELARAIEAGHLEFPLNVSWRWRGKGPPPAWIPEEVVKRLT